LVGVVGSACLAVVGGVFFAMAGYCYHGLEEGVKGIPVSQFGIFRVRDSRFAIWQFGIFRVRDFLNWPHRARLLGAAGRWGVTGGGCRRAGLASIDRAPRLHRACLLVRNSLEDCRMFTWYLQGAGGCAAAAAAAAASPPLPD
jgi:hypothetical protein